MKRKIDPELVKRFRTEREWSQDELAIASGLSNRTIQRIESDGKASSNSVKSIAAALAVDAKILEASTDTRHIGYVSGVLSGYAGVALGSICAVLAVYWNLTNGGTAHEAGSALGIVGLLAGLSCALIGWFSFRYKKSNWNQS